jgi:hypothetical protein
VPLKPEYIRGGWTIDQCWEDLQRLLETKDPSSLKVLFRAFENTYVINGQLLLHPRQLYELYRRESPDPHPLGRDHNPFGWPVHMCLSGHVVDIGIDLYAVNIEGAIYVFRLIEEKELTATEKLLRSAADALATAQKHDPTQNWAGLIDDLRKTVGRCTG